MLRDEIRQVEEIARFESRRAATELLDQMRAISAAVKTLAERVSKLEKLVSGKKTKE